MTGHPPLLELSAASAIELAAEFAACAPVRTTWTPACTNGAAGPVAGAMPSTTFVPVFTAAITAWLPSRPSRVPEPPPCGLPPGIGIPPGPPPGLPPPGEPWNFGTAPGLPPDGAGGGVLDDPEPLGGGAPGDPPADAPPKVSDM